MTSTMALLVKLVFIRFSAGFPLRGESLSLSLCLNSFGGPGGNLAASHSALRYALITASLTPE